MQIYYICLLSLLSSLIDWINDQNPTKKNLSHFTLANYSFDNYNYSYYLKVKPRTNYCTICYGDFYVTILFFCIILKLSFLFFFFLLLLQNYIN